MKQIHEVVAQNLAAYRAKQHMSLDKVSKLTGVSKTMLSQIEKAESNPTITVLWKISSGLRIPLSALTSEVETKVDHIRREQLTPIDTGNEAITIYPYFPFDTKRGFELFVMEFNGKSTFLSEGHYQQSEEYILVNEGELQLLIDRDWHVVREGEAIRFQSDAAHTYKNATNMRLSLTVTVFYQEKND